MNNTKLIYKDELGGIYHINIHKDGSAIVWHYYKTYWGAAFKEKVGDYKTVLGAKRGLSKYCGGMPEQQK